MHNKTECKRKLARTSNSILLPIDIERNEHHSIYTDKTIRMLLLHIKCVVSKENACDYGEPIDWRKEFELQRFVFFVRVFPDIFISPGHLSKRMNLMNFSIVCFGHVHKWRRTVD